MSNHLFCNQCGTQIESDAQFCPKCGASLVEQKVTAPQQFVSQEYTDDNKSKRNILPKLLVVAAVLIIILITAIFAVRDHQAKGKANGVFPAVSF